MLLSFISHLLYAPIYMYSIIPFTYTHKRMHTQYAVVIDAGSSHTKMYFYQWTVPRDKFTGEIHEIDSCKTSSELCMCMELRQSIL